MALSGGVVTSGVAGVGRAQRCSVGLGQNIYRADRAGTIIYITATDNGVRRVEARLKTSTN